MSFVALSRSETPIWGNVISKLERLQVHDELPDNRHRQLLHPAILTRMPNSPRRCIKGTRDFMVRFLGDAEYREEMRRRLGVLNNGVSLVVGEPEPDGSLVVSIATNKGFITICFAKEQLS